MKLVGFLVVGLLALAGCPNQAKNDSSTALNTGNKALGQKQYETAIAEYQKSVEKNRENHLAWYGMGYAYIQKQDYTKAVDALEHTVQLAPDQGMYQMLYGIAEFDKAQQTAREDQARKQNKKPEEIDVDLSAVNFEKSQQHLQESVKLIPQLWRGHYFLGQIARAQGKDKEAADEFTKAIQDNPREDAPYTALSELYLKWDYPDQAIQVASQGAANVPGSNEVAQIWFELGVAYTDKQNLDKAIEAFTKALESKKDYHQAEFERGIAYYRKGDMTNAKRDLEDFSKTGGVSDAFNKQVASAKLMDIAEKAAGVDKPATDQKQSPEDVVKGSKGKSPKKK